MYACYNLLINIKSCIISTKKQQKTKQLFNSMSFKVYILLCLLKIGWGIKIPQQN